MLQVLQLCHINMLIDSFQDMDLVYLDYDDKVK